MAEERVKDLMARFLRTALSLLTAFRLTAFRLMAFRLMAFRLMALFLLTALILISWPVAGVRADSGPILVTFDMHVDPCNNGFSQVAKLDVYSERTELMEWVLDQTEPLSVPISFLSTGWYMEFLLDEGLGGAGATVLQRLYDSGGQVGSHHHDEWRVGAFDWPKRGSAVPLAESRKQWRDNIEWVDAAIEAVLLPTSALSVRSVNRVKGAHAPADESQYHALMSEFQMDVREPGPEEDYYAYFGHHIWHPFRPSAGNYMAEDRTASFVQVPAGPVIGLREIHHGTLQDMTPEAMKRQFIQVYLNWRWSNYNEAEAKVWTYGWASHAADFAVGHESRSALVEMLAWIETNWRNRLDSGGTEVMQYATQIQVADAYVSWEADHPGLSSFSFESLMEEDWDDYPWLRPVAEEMRDYLWTRDLALSGVEAFALEKEGSPAVVLWRETDAPAAVDLAGEFSGPVQVLGLETGIVYSPDGGVEPSSIGVGREPLWVTPSQTVSRLPLLPSVGLALLAALIGGLGCVILVGRQARTFRRSSP